MKSPTFNYERAVDHLISSGVLADYPFARPAEGKRPPGTCPIMRAGQKVYDFKLLGLLMKATTITREFITSNRESYVDALKGYFPVDLLLEHTRAIVDGGFMEIEHIAGIIDELRYPTFRVDVMTSKRVNNTTLGAPKWQREQRRAGGLKDLKFLQIGESKPINDLIKNNPCLVMAILIFQLSGKIYIEQLQEGIKQTAKIPEPDKAKTADMMQTLKENWEGADFLHRIITHLAFSLHESNPRLALGGEITEAQMQKALLDSSYYGAFDQRLEDSTGARYHSTCPAKAMMLKLFGLDRENDGMPTLYNIYAQIRQTGQNSSLSAQLENLTAILAGNHR